MVIASPARSMLPLCSYLNTVPYRSYRSAHSVCYRSYRTAVCVCVCVCVCVYASEPQAYIHASLRSRAKEHSMNDWNPVCECARLTAHRPHTPHVVPHERRLWNAKAIALGGARRQGSGIS
jgi:hypothetical protein